jgi:vacuolar-type H+-ATPase subunit H
LLDDSIFRNFICKKLIIESLNIKKYNALRQQQNEYLKRLRTKQSNIRKAMLDKQKQLIKYLQSNVIKNEKLLDLIYTRIQKHRLGFKEETLELPF